MGKYVREHFSSAAYHNRIQNIKYFSNSQDQCSNLAFGKVKINEKYNNWRITKQRKENQNKKQSK